ncbi:acyl-CoA desaturase [Nostoc sp. DedSLP04]|uniref:acyl-CoA desaturase n=1 Tax=Nostoc sp. DedSLP04 TaxID=3075401 RepID=UPI002AD51D75|nr:acyl-CoA desaturase [Nostoc sp. DedSLP04]MDZ8030428.1 acyl-CoA desaturase [Nostoc sp. DedSLP04]
MSAQLKVSVSSIYLENIKRRFILGIFFISLFGCLAALADFFLLGITAWKIGLLLFMLILTGIGITVGFHRYFAHKTFKSIPVIGIILAILGSMAGQGSVISWVSVHRCHHQYSDRPGDPHSPHLHGEGIGGRLKGLWYAHLGWLLDGELPNSLVFAKDLLQDPIYQKINRLYGIWIILGLILPAILGGIITWSWLGFLQGFIWGGMLRLFFSFNSGYIINSIGHVYGKRLFKNIDQSKNNIWLAILTLGEGWHNNHHAFPNSAKFGLKWWQIDPGYWVIFTLQAIGLAWDVKHPSLEAIEFKKLNEISQ